MYTAKGSDPLELSEAVFDIYNFGYADRRADLFKLIKARDGKNQRDFHALEVGQKPNTIYNYDVVNHLSASGFLNDSGIVKHRFEVTGIVDIKGYPAYEVVFREKEGAKDDSYRGKFYVDTKTYAFIYFDYGLSPTALKSGEVGNIDQRMLLGSADITVDMKRDRYQVSYQKVGDKWVLADVTGDDAVKIKSAELGYDYVADVKFNYQITSVDTNQRASFNTKIARNDNINDYDSNGGEEFWKDYNILLADYNAEDVFKYIQTVNNNTRLKDKFEEKLAKLPADTIQRLNALLKFYNDNGQFNGTALIKSKGKVLLSKSYGYADKASKTEANGHTAYNMGSATDVFTSLIINQLVAEGKLDLHAAIKTYIPYYANGEVTIEQLLTQQSGIPDYLNNVDYKAQTVTQTFTLKQMAINFCSDTLHFKSGGKVEYSNSNALILALIAEEISGKPFGILLQERIFTPLQMTDSYYGANKNATTNQAKGYIKDQIQTDNTNALWISSSAEDLLKFNDALTANKLLSPQQKADMQKPRVQFKDADAWFGYGWMTDKSAFEASKKHVINYEPGNGVGFSAMLVRQDDNDSCILLLNNTGSFPQYDMADLILEMLK
eukprot:gnl/Hemi2/15491_TR5214_c0_g1_i1.p1 gnl/Hemi2/15491_TR5214_c0_g1~~gnl/Hemi2/15491_TR5214_c0_g1_i1.p1  ORF type:complete len:608 (+),score=-78.28 gnl/Hemi2/15491_TR5214_c0_g1_i1:2990-4813(+)